MGRPTLLTFVLLTILATGCAQSVTAVDPPTIAGCERFAKLSTEDAAQRTSLFSASCTFGTSLAVQSFGERQNLGNINFGREDEILPTSTRPFCRAGGSNCGDLPPQGIIVIHVHGCGGLTDVLGYTTFNDGKKGYQHIHIKSCKGKISAL
jgi:hypothetical protein